MRTHLDIINDIYNKLEDSNLIYELKSLRNEVSHHFTATELIGEAGSLLLKMNEKVEVEKSIGQLSNEFLAYSRANGINPKPSELYSIKQKEFVINGNDFGNLKEFYESIGYQLVENNEWGKNWNALNDILIGGFIKTEYGEPIKLTWENSQISKSKLVDFNDIVILIKSHKHIDLELK